MLKRSTVLRISKGIRSLAREALRNLPEDSVAREVAASGVSCPIGYMRYAEFDAVLRDLKLEPGMRILDVSGPQWFTIYLAATHPDVTFYYGNILASEREPFEVVARALGLSNLTYGEQDVRKLTFSDCTFDKVISISVIEHIYPEDDGDVAALREIRRVLKPNGECVLTLPFKDKRHVVYMNGPVYEREGGNKTFFAREYDASQFDELVRCGQMTVRSCWYISERPGWLALDYYEWGPGCGSWFIRYHKRLQERLERLVGRPADDLLAWYYLHVGRSIRHRVVNVAVMLKNEEGDGS
ncbi:MAG: class I SAM-dependent methyltransferase [bacterium]